MGNYNPDKPYVLGMEWAPLLADSVILDTGSEIGYTFRAASDIGLQIVRLLTLPSLPGRATRKEILVNVYPAGGVGRIGPVRKIIVPCSSGALQTGATLQGGAATVQAAVVNPSDAGYVQLSGASAYCRFWFNTDLPKVEEALHQRRILDVSVLYVVSGPFDDLPAALTLGLERPSAGVNWVMDETLTGPASASDNVVVGRSRLGELNPWWSTTSTPASTTMRLPWVYGAFVGSDVMGLKGLSVSGGNNINVRISSNSAAAGKVFQVHYLALEISYAEENRVAGGGLDLSGGSDPFDGDASFEYRVPVRQVLSFGVPANLTAGYDYAVTVGQSHSGQVSLASPVPIRVSRLGHAGPFPSHRGLVLRKTVRSGATPTIEGTDMMPALVLYKGPVGPPNVDVSSHGYLLNDALNIHYPQDFAENCQRVVDESAGEYVWVRFFARRLPNTNGPLEVAQIAADGSLAGPRAQISVDDFDALPEIVSGWREVTLRLSEPAVMTGGGGMTRWGFRSGVFVEDSWQVLVADAAPLYGGADISINRIGYGGETAHATVSGSDDASGDIVVMVAREMDEVTGLAVTPAVQPLATVDPDCGVPASSIPTGIHYHRLSWDEINSEVVAGWGYYELQRQDDTMGADEWETIATPASSTITAVDDYEARVGVETRYRIRMVHRTGIPGPWSTVVAAKIPAPGVAGTRVNAGLLILTSNHNPAGNLAYVTSTERRESEEFTFPEAAQTQLQQLYDRDYRVAFRPTERGGVEFTRTLLVNAAGIPTETLDKGFRGLRDLAWDAVPYVCVRDELANRWLSALVVPSGQVQRVPRRGHLMMSRVTVAEVADTPAPVAGEPPCEGLKAGGGSAQVMTWAPSTGIAGQLAPTAAAATFDTDTVGGWPDTDVGGLRWLVERGMPGDFSASGGEAKIQLARPLNPNPYLEEPANPVLISDTFARDVPPGGLDVADTGQEWTVQQGPPQQFFVADGAGKVAMDGPSIFLATVGEAGNNDYTIKTVFAVDQLAVGDAIYPGFVGCWTDNDNYYLYRVGLTPTGAIDLRFSRIQGGVATTTAAPTSVTHVPGQQVALWCERNGSRHRMMLWLASDTQPSSWPLEVTDTAFTSGRVGMRHTISSANTSPLPVTVSVDSFTVTEPVPGWNAYGGHANRATAQKHEGAASVQVTPNGTSTQAGVSTRRVPVVEGHDYRGTAWVYCAQARNVQITFNWYNAAGSYMNTVGSTATAVPANTWTPLAFASEAPAGAVAANMNIQLPSTPPASALMYVDEAVFSPYDHQMSVDMPPTTDVDVRGRFKVDKIPSGDALAAYLTGRVIDPNNYYRARLAFRTDATLELTIQRFTNGAATILGQYVLWDPGPWAPRTFTPGQWWEMELQVRGAVVRASAWREGEHRQEWQLEVVDNVITAPGRAGAMGFVFNANTDREPTLWVDDFRVRRPFSDVDVRIELRPTDPVWSVIFAHECYRYDSVVYSGWRFDLSQASARVNLYDTNTFFDELVDVTGLAVVGQRRWVRMTYRDLRDGTARASFYTSLDGEVWQLVREAVNTANPPDFTDGHFGMWVEQGVTVMRMEMRQGIDGPVLCSPDFASQPEGTSEFVDGQGRLWRVEDGRAICG